MMEFLDLMLKPFLACMILTGIHAYLGLHVIERGVIFVDLALAQVAALGSTVGILWGWSLHSDAGYFCALSCTLTGAAVLAFTRSKRPRVPQEALIGIVYVICAAASILVLSKAPEGGEELKNLMVGHLLFVDWSEIIKITLIYSVVAVVHWIFRYPLMEISLNPNTNIKNIRAWDFLFYASFGVIVTSSTELAGVLLVFSFLIVPSVCGVILAQSLKNRLFVGWITGVITSIFGIIISYYMDFPTGAAIVCTFTISLLFCFLLKQLMSFLKMKRIESIT